MKNVRSIVYDKETPIGDTHIIYKSEKDRFFDADSILTPKLSTFQFDDYLRSLTNEDLFVGFLEEKKLLYGWSYFSTDPKATDDLILPRSQDIYLNSIRIDERVRHKNLAVLLGLASFKELSADGFEYLYAQLLKNRPLTHLGFEKLGTNEEDGWDIIGIDLHNPKLKRLQDIHVNERYTEKLNNI